jgi:lysyl-tRNA synthetase class 2
MLEYYTMDADYLDSLALTEQFMNHVSGSSNMPLQTPFFRITMEEAFRRWAGFSLAETILAGRFAMEKEARRLGLEPSLEELPETAATAILYDLIFIHRIEPSLPKDAPVVILDYPAFVPCLAKQGEFTKLSGLAKRGGLETRERWELYINGIELANCYTEETDPEELRRFFKEEGEKKEQNALIKHQINENYWKIPSCSGVALGLDRLIMTLTGKFNIEDVLVFPF